MAYESLKCAFLIGRESLQVPPPRNHCARNYKTHDTVAYNYIAFRRFTIACLLARKSFSPSPPPYLSFSSSLSLLLLLPISPSPPPYLSFSSSLSLLLLLPISPSSPPYLSFFTSPHLPSCLFLLYLPTFIYLFIKYIYLSFFFFSFFSAFLSQPFPSNCFIFISFLAPSSCFF